MKIIIILKNSFLQNSISFQLVYTYRSIARDIWHFNVIYIFFNCHRSPLFISTPLKHFIKTYTRKTSKQLSFKEYWRMEIRGTVEQSSLILMKFHRGPRSGYVQQRNESIENTQFPGPGWKSNYNIIARVTMFHLVCVKLRSNRDT